MALECLKRHKFKRVRVGAEQNDGWCNAGLQGFLPAQHAQTPPVSWAQTPKPVFRLRGAEVVALPQRVRQKIGRDLGAEHVGAKVLRVRVAAAVTQKAGERVVRASDQFGAQHVERRGAQGVRAFISVMAVPMRADTSVMLPGTIIVLFFCASCA